MSLSFTHDEGKLAGRNRFSKKQKLFQRISVPISSKKNNFSGMMSHETGKTEQYSFELTKWGKTI
jgi:hypothetical protein